jgi:hypothetical protein
VTDQPYSFTSTVDLPDGRHVYVSIEVPRDFATALPRPEDLGEHTEIAQISAMYALRNMLRADLARTRVDEDGVL